MGDKCVAEIDYATALWCLYFTGLLAVRASETAVLRERKMVNLLA